VKAPSSTGVRGGWHRVRKRVGGKTGASLLRDLEEASRRMQDQFGPNIVDQVEQWARATLLSAGLPADCTVEKAEKAGHVQGSEVMFAVELAEEVALLRAAIARSGVALEALNPVVHHTLHLGALIREVQDQKEWGRDINAGLGTRLGGRRGAAERWGKCDRPHPQELRRLFAQEHAKGLSKTDAKQAVKRLTNVSIRTIERAISDK
jgi:hypothetical protein